MDKDIKTESKEIDFEYWEKNALLIDKPKFREEFDALPLDSRIEIYNIVVNAVPEWCEHRPGTYSILGADLIREAETAKQIDAILGADKQFIKKKWSEFDYKHIKEMSPEHADNLVRYFREHEQTQLYMSAAVNPNISEKTLEYVLQKTAQTNNDVDKADVVSGALHNPKLKPEHYDALIDCFRNGPNITDYHGSDILELKGLSLDQLKRFAKVVNETVAPQDPDRYVGLKSKIAKKKFELQKQEKNTAKSVEPTNNNSGKTFPIDKGPSFEL